MRTLQARLLSAVVLILGTLQGVYAGDDASGRTPFSVDLSQPFTTYSMTAKDKLWSKSLAEKFNYKAKIVHFVRTSLPLKVGVRDVEGVVYQSVERPDFFYILNGDAMLRIGGQWAYSPGVGGFSMHAPKSKNFIVCLNFVAGGVPFLSSTPVRKGVVTWKGDDHRSRLR